MLIIPSGMYNVHTKWRWAMATTASARLNFRIPVETERRLRAAAEAAHETLTEFVLGPAQARAEEMLSAKTVVPADYFDRLLAALDEPPEPMPVLAEASRRPRRYTQH
jgi:uncharacterized protein (DUF1778 family)